MYDTPDFHALASELPDEDDINSARVSRHSAITTLRVTGTAAPSMLTSVLNHPNVHVTQIYSTAGFAVSMMITDNLDKQ
jgi:hypothetical protein